MVNTADCGSVTRGFDSHISPHMCKQKEPVVGSFFVCNLTYYGIIKKIEGGSNEKNYIVNIVCYYIMWLW